jgi:hypothetical protein
VLTFIKNFKTNLTFFSTIFLLIILTSCSNYKTFVIKDNGKFKRTKNNNPNTKGLKDKYRVYKIPDIYCNPLDTAKLIQFADKVFKKNTRRMFHDKRNVDSFYMTSNNTGEFSHHGFGMTHRTIKLIYSTESCKIFFIYHSGYF